MKKEDYTNISTKPLGELDGIPVRPCMKSGFCCTTAPCGFGESISKENKACKFLGPPNDIGQRDCGKYQWIIDNVEGYEFYPGFGTGCCMPMFNEAREKIIKNIENIFLSE